MEFGDKVVLIGGAGGGIGRAASLAFARRGASLALCDASASGLEETVNQLKAHSEAEEFSVAPYLTGVVDVRHLHAIRDWMLQVKTSLGRVDILVNLIGIWRQSPVEQVTEEEWDAVMDINLKGVFFLCQAAMRQMREQGGGCIINVSSAVGETGSARHAAPYSASKGGIIAMSKAMAREGAPHIRVNVISPGPIDTAMLAGGTDEEKREIANRCLVGRLGTPEDIAEAAVYLAAAIPGLLPEKCSASMAAA